MAVLLELLRAVAALAIGLALFGLVERFARGDGKGPAFRRPGFATDVAWWMLTPLLTRVITRVGVGIAVFLVAWCVVGQRLDGPALRSFLERPTWASRMPFALELAITLGAADLCGYWTHRAFHRGWLWRSHAVHHSSTRLDWLAAVRVHPINDLLGGVSRVTILVVLGFRPVVLAGVVPFLTIYALLLHANVAWSFGPLAKVVASPLFHRLHHARDVTADGANFAGFFAFWDVLFGTFRDPRDVDVTVPTGVREPMPATFFGQLLYPFRARKAPSLTRS